MCFTAPLRPVRDSQLGSAGLELLLSQALGALMVEYGDVERAILSVIATIVEPPLALLLWLIDRISRPNG